MFQRHSIQQESNDPFFDASALKCSYPSPHQCRWSPTIASSPDTINPADSSAVLEKGTVDKAPMTIVLSSLFQGTPLYSNLLVSNMVKYLCPIWRCTSQRSGVHYARLAHKFRASMDYLDDEISGNLDVKLCWKIHEVRHSGL